MRVYIAVFGLCVIAAIVTSQPYSTPRTEQNSESSQAPQRGTADVKEKPDQTGSHQTETDNHTPKWYTALKRPEWWLVLLGFLTLGVIAYQAIEMRRATEAMQGSAKAFINKERPRLFIQHQITTDFCAAFRAVNRGQSPAKITYAFVGARFWIRKTTSERCLSMWAHGKAQRNIFEMNGCFPASLVRLGITTPVIFPKRRTPACTKP